MSETRETSRRPLLYDITDEASPLPLCPACKSLAHRKSEGLDRRVVGRTVQTNTPRKLVDQDNTTNYLLHLP